MSKTIAFGNMCAIVDTAPLNRRATCASALPTNYKFAGALFRAFCNPAGNQSRKA